MPTSTSWWPPRDDALVDGGLTLLPWSHVHTVPGVREDLFAASTDDRMVAWTTVPSPFTEEMLDDFLGSAPDGVFRWALVVDARYAGNIELRLEPDGAANFGYNTAPWARGRGFMTRAVRLVTDHAFARGAETLKIEMLPGNSASRHVAESNGYTFAAEHGCHLQYRRSRR